jgi:hypothetical protein
MDTEIKATWRADLRSGRYEQGREALCRIVTDDGEGKEYCCLGVLCEQAVRAGIVEHVFNGADYGHPELIGYRVPGSTARPDFTMLPLAVATWAGLGTDIDPEVELHDDEEGEAITANLSDVNDNYGEGFHSIALLINQL